jgi:hypothetical protein
MRAFFCSNDLCPFLFSGHAWVTYILRRLSLGAWVKPVIDFWYCAAFGLSTSFQGSIQALKLHLSSKKVGRFVDTKFLLNLLFWTFLLSRCSLIHEYCIDALNVLHYTAIFLTVRQRLEHAQPLQAGK